MKTTYISIAIASLSLIGLTACDVDKTQEGNLSMPKYQVEKKAEGDVTLPKYDVKTPDVAVQKEEKTVEVPTIETEKKQVEVPTVKVTPPEDNKDNQQATK